MKQSALVTPEMQAELIEFAQSLVRIKSFSGQEQEIVEFVAQKMTALGYDEVTIDGLGSVVGRIGSGPKAILFDSHVDTVEVTDEEKWDVPPFSGRIVDGCLYGRGSVDMKSAVAASVYAAAIARQAGLAEGKTIYVSCSVFEEDCDGENLKNMFRELALRPDCVVICEPSVQQDQPGAQGQGPGDDHDARHLGPRLGAGERAQRHLRDGRDHPARREAKPRAHAEAGPDRDAGHVTDLQHRARRSMPCPRRVRSTWIAGWSPGETADDIKREMDGLIAGKRATWQVGTLQRTSWTGREIRYEPFHLAWRIGAEHELTQACIAAYRAYFGREPGGFDFWDFSTNAVTPVSLGIPTIGFGPGEHKQAHMCNENCPVEQIVDACGFYVRLIGLTP